ncbi:conserved membrane hypothetical protein [Tenacibaculum sp. 190524A02b]|uniref:CPBP family intramembrane metalloprotease n=1 Tax=Tenacibaculum vairaonense TaxID=3137860 RepID=A0ABM9PK27_9FLAO
MIKELCKELFFFIKRPKEKNITLHRKKKFLKNIKQFVLFDIFVSFISIVLLGGASMVFEDLNEVIKTNNNFSGVPFLKQVFFLCLLFPLVEELIFRIGLKINRLNIAVYIGFQTMAILTITEFLDRTSYIRLLFAVCVSIIVFFLLKEKQLGFFRKNFRWFVYYNVLFFWLIHAGNYTYSYPHQYLYIPVITLVPLILGVYLSYARITYGFVFAFFIHFLHNFTTTLIQFYLSWLILT